MCCFLLWIDSQFFRLMYTVLIIFSLAVLVYLNYKNAYEHWNEQRLALNKEVSYFHYVHIPLIQFEDVSHFRHLFWMMYSCKAQYSLRCLPLV